MTATANSEVDEGPRSKRSAILAAAIACFGEYGYDATKWSSIADRVGIGQTALYHYFESKAHCLLFIMQMELQRTHQLVLAAAPPDRPARDGFRAALESAFDVSDQEVLQMRILQNNMALLAPPRHSEREERTRTAARALVGQIELDWTALIQRGMDEGAFPQRDAGLLARVMLGQVVGVWRWYRPGGPQSLAEVSAFVVDCCVRMVEN